jgi:hypothetical protein
MRVHYSTAHDGEVSAAIGKVIDLTKYLPERAGTG